MKIQYCTITVTEELEDIKETHTYELSQEANALPTEVFIANAIKLVKSKLDASSDNYRIHINAGTVDID